MKLIREWNLTRAFSDQNCKYFNYKTKQTKTQMRFSFFAVLATAVSAASLNAMVDNDYTFDLYEAEDLDYAQTWDVKKTEETATKAADD